MRWQALLNHFFIAQWHSSQKSYGQNIFSYWRNNSVIHLMVYMSNTMLFASLSQSQRNSLLEMYHTEENDKKKPPPFSILVWIHHFLIHFERWKTITFLQSIPTSEYAQTFWRAGWQCKVILSEWKAPLTQVGCNSGGPTVEHHPNVQITSCLHVRQRANECAAVLQKEDQGIINDFSYCCVRKQTCQAGFTAVQVPGTHWHFSN